MSTTADAMSADVSTVRLHMLRGMYLLMAVGLGATIWPLILTEAPDVAHMRAVVWSLLGGLGLVSLLGLRYPVQMIPLLLFELTWKVIWVLAFGLPLWLDGRLDAASSQTLIDCLIGVVLVPIAIPWRYTLARFARAPGARWRNVSTATG